MPASAAGVENQELRRTMGTQGEENERLAAEREESLRRATHGELAQLRETVIALREQLDAGRLDEEGRAQRAVAAVQGAAAQLRETIVAPRDEPEAARGARPEGGRPTPGPRP